MYQQRRFWRMGNNCFKTSGDDNGLVGTDGSLATAGPSRGRFSNLAHPVTPPQTYQHPSPNATNRQPRYEGNYNSGFSNYAEEYVAPVAVASNYEEPVKSIVPADSGEGNGYEDEDVDDLAETLDAALDIDSAEDETEAIVDERNAGYTPAQDEQQMLNTAYVDFPFLTSRAINWISRNRTMFIMRGIPGSGKSTLVKIMHQKYRKARVCSADFFWIQPDGSYQFNKTKLNDAHNQCQNDAYNACDKGNNPVIIDNTNIQAWEFKYYIDIAKRYGYVVIMVIPKTPWRFDVNMCTSCNHHRVPRAIIEKKVQQFDRAIPLYCGWFLGSAFEDRLANRGWTILEQLIADDDIRRTFTEDLGLPPNTPGARLTRGRYSPPAGLLHVTARFCDGGRAPGSLDYFQRDQVQDAIGRMDTIDVLGFVLTPRTLAARVRLNKISLNLWDQNDNEGLPRQRRGARGRPKGCRAHVTLGLAPRVNAVQSGPDLLDIVDLERSRAGSPCGQIGQDTVTYFGEGRFQLKLRSPIKVQTIFSGCY